MYFLEITTTRHHQQRLLLVENILLLLYTKIPNLTIYWAIISLIVYFSGRSFMEWRVASTKLNLYGGHFRNLWMMEDRHHGLFEA